MYMYTIGPQQNGEEYNSVILLPKCYLNIDAVSYSQYSCYSTCIASGNETEEPICVAVSPTFPLNEPTKVLSGPYHLQQYHVHKIFSPTDDDSQLYPDSHFCKYENTIATAHLTKLSSCYTCIICMMAINICMVVIVEIILCCNV